jgi:ComF family protein
VLALLHRFKYGGCVELAGPLAALLRAAFRRHFPGVGIDAIVPVPLHAKRLRSRGFNQAELLVRRWQALHPHDQAGGILLPGALIRRRHTPAQAGLGRKERMVNLRGAFSAGPKDAVCGMRVLLVDDVYTTGATVGECARVLAGAGAARIDVLTLARAL